MSDGEARAVVKAFHEQWLDFAVQVSGCDAPSRITINNT